MKCQRRARFVPVLDRLEARLVPAATVTTFKSNPTLPVEDSILIRGSGGMDRMRIEDTGAAVRVFDGETEKANPIASPVIVRIELLAGNDALNYLVPGSVVLKRKVEVASGPGRNAVLFDNAQAGGNGIDLDPGSTFRIAHDGAGSKLDNFHANFGEVIGASVDLHLAFGGGGDTVKLHFMDDIDEDSRIAVSVDLDDSRASANTCEVMLGEFATDIGFDDVAGSRVDMDIQGGSHRDIVNVIWNFFRVGNSMAKPATRVSVDSHLGGGNDDLSFLHEAQSVIHENAGVRFKSHGGAGNDRMLAQQGERFPGGQIVVQGGGVLDVALFGDRGSDMVQLFYDESVNGGQLDVAVGGLTRFYLDGGSGRDRVLSRLHFDEIITGAGGSADVKLLGGTGPDTMGLAITDQEGMTYTGGLALFDGGQGANVLDNATGVAGPVRRLNV